MTNMKHDNRRQVFLVKPESTSTTPNLSWYKTVAKVKLVVSTVHVNVDEAKFSTGPFDAPQLFHVGSVGFSLQINLSRSNR